MRLFLLRGMLLLYSLSALLGIASVLAPANELVRLLATSALLAGAFTAVFLQALLAETGLRSLRWVMYGGIVCSTVALCIWLGMVWIDPSYPTSEFVARWGGAATFFALWTIHLGYCFSIRVRASWFHWMRWCLVALGFWFLLLFQLMMIDEDIVEWMMDRFPGGEEAFSRITGALSLLFVVVSLALPIIWLLERFRHRNADSGIESSATSVALTCPRCGFAQELPINRAACAQCRLDIRIKIEEPRCACGFLLYRFDGQECPECGRAVPEELRWASGETSRP